MPDLVRKIAQFFGRRGGILFLFGLAWIVLGLNFLVNPVDRFSAAYSPPEGGFFDALDSHLFGLLWILGGLTGLINSLVRRSVGNEDAIGYTALILPCLVWLSFYFLSFISWLATDGEFGRQTAAAGIPLYAIIGTVLIMISGWPDSSDVKPSTEGERALYNDAHDESDRLAAEKIPPVIDILLAAEPVAPSGINPGIIIAVIASTLALVGTVVGAVLTYRLGRKNAAEAREAKEKELEQAREQKAKEMEAASWVAQIENWRNDVVTLRQQRQEDQAEYRAHREACDARIQAQAERLDDVLHELEVQRQGNRQLEDRHDALVFWSVQVIRIMQQNGVVFPPPPPTVATLIAVDPNIEEL